MAGYASGCLAGEAVDSVVWYPELPNVCIRIAVGKAMLQLSGVYVHFHLGLLMAIDDGRLCRLGKWKCGTWKP